MKDRCKRERLLLQNKIMQAELFCPFLFNPSIGISVKEQSNWETSCFLNRNIYLMSWTQVFRWYYQQERNASQAASHAGHLKQIRHWILNFRDTEQSLMSKKREINNLLFRIPPLPLKRKPGRHSINFFIIMITHHTVDVGAKIDAFVCFIYWLKI